MTEFMFRSSLRLALLASVLPNFAFAAPIGSDAVMLNEVVVDRAPDPTVQPRDVTVLPGTEPVRDYVPRDSYTATKTGAKLIETPQAVSVVGAQQIRDLNEQNLGEAVEYVSGVLPSTFGFDTRNDFFLIRGFPAQQTGYFLDGLQLYSLSFGAFRVNPFGLERIEVLKGPASVLYGGSNVGGIVNAVSKTPPEKAFGYLEAGINNYGNAYGYFDIGGPVSNAKDNTLYYRLDGLLQNGGTQLNFVDDNKRFIAPSVSWRPDRDTTLTVLGSFEKDNTKNPVFLPYVGTVVPNSFGKISTSLFTSDPGADRFQRDQNLIGYQFSHRFDDTFTVRQNMRFSDLRVNESTLLGLGYAYGTSDSQGLIGRGNYQTTPHVTEVALDNQLEGHFRTGDLLHTTLLGLDYKHYTLSDIQGFGSASNFDVLRPVYTFTPLPTAPLYLNNFNVQDQLGEYLQEQAKYGPLTLVLSGRHDNVDQSQFGRPTAYGTAPSSESFRSAFTGRAGLIYTTPWGLAPYGTVATSFDPQLGTNTVTGTPLVPTTGKLGEVGVKYQPTFIPLNFTASLFDITEANVLTTNPNLATDVTQTGQVRSRGFELETSGYIARGLKILGSYTGYNLRTTESNDPTLIGKVLTATPQNFGALFLDYTIQNGPLVGFGGGAGPRFVGGSFADAQNTYGVPGYVVADANLHYDREHWRAALNVRNVFDRSVVSTCSTINACFYDIRRTATFSLAYRW